MKYCCILNYSFGLFSISILCTGNLISMCAISRESTSKLYTVINMSFGFYSCYIFVSSVSPYSISNSSPFIVCKSDSTSVRGLWVLRIYILSISGGVLSSNWSLCLKLPLCLLILELDASNYRLVHTLNYRRFFFLLPGPVFLSNCDRDLPFQSRVTFSCIYWTMNLVLNWLVQLFLVHHSCLLLI